MTRVALYARYSSDNQRAASIEDQSRLCEERTTREGSQVVEYFTVTRRSPQPAILRPGIQTLLRDPQARQFDIVLGETLHHVSREPGAAVIRGPQPTSLKTRARAGKFISFSARRAVCRRIGAE